MFELKATEQKKASLNCESTGRNEKHVFHISSREKAWVVQNFSAPECKLLVQLTCLNWKLWNYETHKLIRSKIFA